MVPAMINMPVCLGDETAAVQQERLIRRAVLATFVVYIVFGLPDGIFGTVWPNLRDHFDRSDGDLGLLILATAVGYAAGGVSSGAVTERFGIARPLPIAMSAASVALALVIIAPAFWVVALAYVVLGTGWGLTDAGINAWMALTQGPREMGALHAAYGIGVFVGPLVATAFVADGAGWRGPFVVCLPLTIVAVGSLIRARQGFRDAPTTPEIAGGGEPPHASRALRLLFSWFSLYVGVEVAVGTWAFTLLTEGRDVSEAVAGVLTSLYWGGLLAGRIALAALGHRVRPEPLIRFSTYAALAAATLLWIDPAGAGGAGLPLIGLALSTMFPLAMGRTAAYVGEARAVRAVGYQIGATSIGFAALSALIGVLADAHGVGVAAPTIVVSIVALAALWLVLERTVAPSAAVVDG